MCMQLSEGDVLAVWVFLHPTIVKKANEWLLARKFKKGFAGQSVLLTYTQAQQLQADMGADEETDLAYVRIVKQGHGDLVHVPAGWLHQVHNVRACIKMAFEKCEPERLLNYVLSWQYIAARYTTSSNSADYMAIMAVISKVCTELDYFCRVDPT